MQALQAVLIVSRAELYWRYNVTSYRRVPAARFAEVVAWLEGWLEAGRVDDQDAGETGGE